MAELPTGTVTFLFTDIESEDAETIVRLAKQVVTVSLETVKIVHSLPRIEAVAVRSSGA